MCISIENNEFENAKDAAAEQHLTVHLDRDGLDELPMNHDCFVFNIVRLKDL